MRLLAACAALLAAAAQAAPFVPVDDAQVVQRLPYRVSAEERAQRAALARAPQQLGLALQTAQAALQRARRLGDPRELGLAQAALAPWWQQPDAPPAVRLLRATVRQSQHDFEGALADLDALAGDHPATPLPVQAQAGLTRAAVLQVGGRLADAAHACQDLLAPRFAPLGTAVALPARACVAELGSLQGRAPQAAAELAALARGAPGDGWLALLRAELAERQGSAAAEALFRQALAAQGDVYTRSAHADWLLGERRAAEALAVVDAAGTGGEAPQADALLLRRAIALQRSGRAAEAATVAATLGERLAAARARGENFHAREEASLALDVLNQPAQALALAQQNWQRQREPADALLLLRAAVAAGQPQAAEPVRRLMREGWADVRLVRADAPARPAAKAAAQAPAQAPAQAGAQAGTQVPAQRLARADATMMRP